MICVWCRSFKATAIFAEHLAMTHSSCDSGCRWSCKKLAYAYFEGKRDQEGIISLVESHAAGFRRNNEARRYEHIADLANGWLPEHGGQNEHNGVPPMMERLFELPEEWSLVQLSYAHDPRQGTVSFPPKSNQLNPPALHITRFECGKNARINSPFCITIPIQKKMCSLEAELHAIIRDHQNKLVKDHLTDGQYLGMKKHLDASMMSIVTKLQNDWLGHWIGLLIGRYAEPDFENRVESFVERLLKQLPLHKQHAVTAKSRRNLFLLVKASPYLSEQELCAGIGQCMAVPDAKDLACRIKKFSDFLPVLLTLRRHPVILILEEELEVFPWEMLNVLQDQPVCRIPCLQMLYALYKAHEKNISGGRLQVDAELGYYIVNPDQQLPYTEGHLEPFLTVRAPNWKGTYGAAPPPSKKFMDMLQNSNIFIYAGRGEGSEFLKPNDIRKLNIRAVTFLCGCLCVSSRDPVGQADCATKWHFYLTASCPMVIGSLWNVTDRAVDGITITTLGNWLPVTKEMMDVFPEKYSELYKKKCEPDLLCALKRSHTSSEHYMATAALVARGLPVVIKVKDGMNTGTALEQESN